MQGARAGNRDTSENVRNQGVLSHPRRLIGHSDCATEGTRLCCETAVDFKDWSSQEVFFANKKPIISEIPSW